MKRILAIFLLLLCLPATALSQLTPAAETQSLGDIARQLRAQKEASSAVSNPTPTVETPVTDLNQLNQPSSQAPVGTMLNPKLLEDDELAYTAKVRDLFSNENFEELDRMADAARTSKARLLGGNWQIYIFYDAVTQPEGDHVSVADWQAMIDRLKRWQAALPRSITADVALAQAYINLGWQSRGTGDSDSVAERGWKGLGDNLEQAKAALSAAAALPDKCPQQYAVAQNIALIEGWDKAKANALFDEAVSFEPDYYYYYRNMANYLQERWYGDPGEAVEFAARWASRLGGKRGLFVYFEIATVLTCNCAAETVLPTMSWKMIKDGYSALEELYGTSLLKRNRFAYIAFRENDRTAAQRAMLQIKSNWNVSVWGNRRTFEQARMWALNEKSERGF